MARDAFRMSAGVDEDERRAVLARELRETVIDLRPDIARHDCFERRRGHLDLQVALADVTGVDDGAIGRAVGAQLSGADEKSRHLLDRTLGCREADARQAAPGEGLESLERQRQVQAALAADHRVDLIDDDAVHAREHGPSGLRAEEDVERLRSGDHDVRRAPAHALPLVLRRVAGPHEGADLDIGQLHRAQLVADAGERRLEVAPDVVGKRLER